MKNIIGIDLDALRSQAETLRSQLQDIEAVIRIVSGDGQPAVVPVAEPEPAPEKPKKSIENPGRRKAVIMALHTGPSSTRDLTRALVWDAHDVRVTLKAAEKVGYVEVSSGDIWSLTKRGKEVAQWFLGHLTMTTYCPSRVTG